jgi:hypothetical protein
LRIKSLKATQSSILWVEMRQKGQEEEREGEKVGIEPRLGRVEAILGVLDTKDDIANSNERLMT